MRATGILRRVDDLGRVVIPKEIRRNLRIREGDALEIFTDNDMVCFKRYRVDEEFNEELARIRDSITDEYDCREFSNEVDIIRMAFEEIRLQLLSIQDKINEED